MTWVLELTGRAERALHRAPVHDQERLGRAVDEMRLSPFTGAVCRVHGAPNEWRRRVGRWRILFTVHWPDRRVVIHDIVRRTSTTY